MRDVIASTAFQAFHVCACESSILFVEFLLRTMRQSSVSMNSFEYCAIDNTIAHDLSSRDVYCVRMGFPSNHR